MFFATLLDKHLKLNDTCVLTISIQNTVVVNEHNSAIRNMVHV